MTWLTDHGSEVSAGERLAQMWRAPGIVAIPGAHHALAAMLAKRAGFKAIYVSGAALTASMGLADLGLIGLDELCFFTRSIARACGLPMVVDADTGFGGTLNVMRAVRELEEAGAAAIQIEDQVMPKKCGHLNDKRLVAPEEMATKIAAAVRARRHLRIIARTDAAAAEGLEGALARARLYVAAGADAIFPEALSDEAMFRAFAREIRVPLLANMTEFGRTPYFTARQFEEFGFKSSRSSALKWSSGRSRLYEWRRRRSAKCTKRSHETAAPWRCSHGCRREQSSTGRSVTAITKRSTHRSRAVSCHRRWVALSISISRDDFFARDRQWLRRMT